MRLKSATGAGGAARLRIDENDRFLTGASPDCKRQCQQTQSNRRLGDNQPGASEVEMPTVAESTCRLKRSEGDNLNLREDFDVRSSNID
jgi:hypothetical protein